MYDFLSFSESNMAALESWLCLEPASRRGNRFESWRMPKTFTSPPLAAPLSSPPAPAMRAPTSTIVCMALSKKPKISTMACIKSIVYPIQPLGPSVTPSEGAKDIMRRIVANRRIAKKV
jgi:hypothetical protein